MLYYSIEKLLEANNKTWTDMLFETKLSPNFINRSLSNTYTQQELKTISEYFNIKYSEIVNYAQNTNDNSHKKVTGIKDFNLTTNINALLQKILQKTRTREIIWVMMSKDDAFCNKLPDIENNSISLINLKDNYTYNLIPYRYCFFTEYKRTKYFIRSLEKGKLILSIISKDDDMVTYNTPDDILGTLYNNIKEINGVNSWA